MTTNFFNDRSPLNDKLSQNVTGVNAASATQVATVGGATKKAHQGSTITRRERAKVWPDGESPYVLVHHLVV